ncbi:MAG: hypothetical protein E3J37_00520 [Anaerolineales bacterium]|nr:MAG: hypothetical protein E3J37_00520 [Anaerolineales bacterium]
MNINKKVAVTAAVLIALIALIGATVAFAQVPLFPEGTVSVQADGEHHRRRDGLIDREKVQAAVAEALGISVEELQAARTEGKTLSDLAEELGVDLEVVRAARQAALEEAVQQAVEDGFVTQEQAEKILSHEGHWRPRGQRGDDPGHERGIRGGHSAIAEKLGITVDEFQAARAEGKTLADLAKELGIDLEEVRADTRGVHAESLQQAVEEGRITQEQANKILSGEGRWGAGGHNQGERPFNRRPFLTP